MELNMTQKVDLKAAVAALADYQATEMTVAELVDAYTAANPDGTAARLRKWQDAFAAMSAWELPTEAITACASALVNGGYAPASVNRDVSALGSAYRWAQRLRLTPRGFRSPTLGVERYAEPIRRVELKPEEIQRLLSRSIAFRDRRFGAFVHLLVDTGARKSEILDRTWDQVDLDAGTILCPTTKTDKPRVLHFQQDTANLMRRCWKSMPAEQLLFASRIPCVPLEYRTQWRTLTRDIGLPDLHMHDIRHVAAASLLRAGVTIAVASQVLGHSSLILNRRYGHLETGALRAAQELRWGTTA